MKRALAILAGGLLCLWLWAPPAGAHALLVSSDPAAGATVATSPPQVTLTFTEPPDPKLSTVHVLNETGTPVDRVRRACGRRAARSSSRCRWDRSPMARTRSRGGRCRRPTATSRRGRSPSAWAPRPKAPITPGTSAPTTPPPSPLSVIGKWMLYLGLAAAHRRRGGGAARVAGAPVVAVVPGGPGRRLARGRRRAGPRRGGRGPDDRRALPARSSIRRSATSSWRRQWRSSWWAWSSRSPRWDGHPGRPSALGLTVAAALFVHVLGGHADAPER